MGLGGFIDPGAIAATPSNFAVWALAIGQRAKTNKVANTEFLKFAMPSSFID
jgi:hypothetical protein